MGGDEVGWHDQTEDQQEPGIVHRHDRQGDDDGGALHQDAFGQIVLHPLQATDIE